MTQAALFGLFLTAVFFNVKRFPVRAVCQPAAGRGISGTPLFMFPEQARGLVYLDARSDIYSVGAIGSALLNGRPPFDGTNSMEVMIAPVRDEVVPPSNKVT